MLSIVIIPSFHKLNSENYPQTIIEIIDGEQSTSRVTRKESILQ